MECGFMSNRLFQGVVHQMRDTIDRTIGVVDESGVVIACSDLSRIGEVNDAVMPEQIIGQEGFTAGSYSFKPFGGHPHSEYAVFVEAAMRQLPNMLPFLLFRSTPSSSIMMRNTTEATS